MKTLVKNYAGQLIALAFFVILFFISLAMTAQTEVAYNNIDAETHIQAYNIHESTNSMNEMDVIYTGIELINTLEDMIEWTQHDIIEGHVSEIVGREYINNYLMMIDTLNYMLYDRRED
jgi:hypothetical protein